MHREVWEEGSDDGRNEREEEEESENGCDRVDHGRACHNVGLRGNAIYDKGLVSGCGYGCDCDCHRDGQECGHVDEEQEWWRESASRIDLEEEEKTRVVGLGRYPFCDAPRDSFAF